MISILATFTFLYEAFLSVRPSVAFFCHFYNLWMPAPGEVTGCVSFRLSECEAAKLITMAVKKKVDDFRRYWVFMDTGLINEVLLELPID